MTSPLLAHGISGRSDLPLDLSFFLMGGGLVLVVTFVALAVRWPQPRLQDGPLNRPLNAPWLRTVSAALMLGGLMFFLLTLVAGLVGRDDGSENIVPVIIWVLVWLVVPFAASVLGNLWTVISPWSTMTRLFRFGDEDPSVSESLGVYPAVVAFVAFVWLELISPSSGGPEALAIATLAYTFYVFGFASWAGPQTGLRVAEFFTTYIGLLSSIAPFGRDDSGRLVWRGWLRALPVGRHLRGTTLFVVAMIGTVTFDGLSGAPWWDSTVAGLDLDPSSRVVATAGLLLIVVAVGLAYLGACLTAVRLGGSEFTTTRMAQRFTHTLVPIALAYAVAHYFTLVVFEGQLLWIHASDPLGLGWNLFGTADWTVQIWLSPTAIWNGQVAAIVIGHVGSLVLAHDRALADFDPAVAVRTQYPMLVLMVLLTGLGLTILAIG